MNRYVLYLFVLVSLMNLMLYVPRILIEYRYSGSVMSLIVSPLIGAALVYMYSSALAKFPGLGLPEILNSFCPRWLTSVVMLFYAAMWWFSGTAVIVIYAILINRFFNPDAEIMIILIVLILASGYAATRSTLTVMFIIEVGIILNAPVILFVLFKMVRSPQLNYDAIQVVATHIASVPNLATLAAATLIFTGYIHLSLFNRLLPPNFRFKHRWIYPLLGFVILLVTFFVPIGFHGTEGVDRYIYTWSVTADSIAMQYGFIERVMFLFLLVFLNLSLLYTMTSWHLAMEFVKSCRRNNKPEIDSPKAPISDYVIIGVFAALSIVFSIVTNEKSSFQITKNWLILRMFAEILTVVWIFLLSRRGLRAK